MKKLIPILLFALFAVGCTHHWKYQDHIICHSDGKVIFEESNVQVLNDFDMRTLEVWTPNTTMPHVIVGGACVISHEDAR